MSCCWPKCVQNHYDGERHGHWTHPSKGSVEQKKENDFLYIKQKHKTNKLWIKDMCWALFSGPRLSSTAIWPFKGDTSVVVTLCWTIYLVSIFFCDITQPLEGLRSLILSFQRFPVFVSEDKAKRKHKIGTGINKTVCGQGLETLN